MNFTTTTTTTNNHWKGYVEGQQQNNNQGLAPRRRMNQGETQSQGGMNSPTYSDEEHGIMMTTTDNTPYDINTPNDDGDEPPALLMVAPTDSHVRSLLKGVTWRFLATATTVIIAWFVTGEVGQALRIGFVEFFAKLAIYYAHERIWAKIRTV
jgi:uncharacterized membrane protein